MAHTWIITASLITGDYEPIFYEAHGASFEVILVVFEVCAKYYDGPAYLYREGGMILEVSCGIA